MTNITTVADWSRADRAYHDGQRAYIEFGAALAELNRNGITQQAIAERYDISQSSVGKAIAVGNDQRVIRSANNLPKSSETIYLLTKLDDDDFATLCKPETIRADILRHTAPPVRQQTPLQRPVWVSPPAPQQDDLATENARLKASTLELQTDNDELIAENAELKAEVATLQASLESLITNHTQLLANNDELFSECVKLAAENKALKAQLAALQTPAKSENPFLNSVAPKAAPKAAPKSRAAKTPTPPLDRDTELLRLYSAYSVGSSSPKLFADWLATELMATPCKRFCDDSTNYAMLAPQKMLDAHTKSEFAELVASIEECLREVAPKP